MDVCHWLTKQWVVGKNSQDQEERWQKILVIKGIQNDKERTVQKYSRLPNLTG